MTFKGFIAKKKVQLRQAGVRYRREQAEISAVRREERVRQSKKTAILREREIGKRNRASVRSGGSFGSFAPMGVGTKSKSKRKDWGW